MIRVVAAAIVRGSRVLAAQRGPDTSRPRLWELPGGKVEPGETDAAALVRELVEELGVTVAVGARLGEAVHRYPDITVQLVAYRCTLAAGEPRPLEHAALRWVDAGGLDALDWASADRALLPAVRDILSPRGAAP